MTAKELKDALKKAPKDALAFVEFNGSMHGLSTIVLQREQALAGTCELVSPIVILKGEPDKFEPETE
jgi:hypothetical protein